MLVKLTKGFSVSHDIIQIYNLNDVMVTVYDKNKGLDKLQNTIQNPWFKYPVEVLVDTAKILIVRQVNIDKLEKLKV